MLKISYVRALGLALIAACCNDIPRRSSKA